MPGTFAAMCAAQMPTPPGGEAQPSASAVPASVTQKPVGKTTQSVPTGPADSGKNRAPVVPGGAVASILLLLPIPAPTLATTAPQPSSDLSSSLIASTSADSAHANESVQVTKGASLAGPAQWPTLELNTLATRTSFDLPVPSSSSETIDVSDGISLSLDHETSFQPEALSPNPQDEVAGNVLSLKQPAIPSNPAPLSVDPPASSDASSANPSLPREQTASTVVLPSQAAVASVTSDFANLVSIPSQAQDISQANTFSTQSDRMSGPQPYPQTDEVQAGADEIRESLEPGNVAPASAGSATFRKENAKQAAAAQASPETPSPTIKPNPTLAQILLGTLQTPESKAIARLAVEPSVTPTPPGNAVPDAQADHPFSGLSLLSPTTVNSGNSSMQPGTNTNQPSIVPTGGGNAIEPPTAAQTAAASGTAAISAPPVSSGSNPDPQPRATNSVNAPPGAASMSAPPAALAAGGTETPSATRQSPIPGPTHKSDSSAPNSADVSSNFAGLREPSASLVTGPVQMAQIVSRAAQSEMRIGLNTSAFGNVEVRTVVHANEVGVLIGSEKGDLRSFLSNELPSIANTLQTQNLRLNQVSFHQQGFAFSSQTSSGSGSQQRSFASRPITPTALPSELANAESDEPVSSSTAAYSRGLSILA